MHLDKFSLPVFNRQDIESLIYKGFTDVAQITAEDSYEITQFNKIAEQFGSDPIRIHTSPNIAVKEFDAILQDEWLMPDEYKLYDIVDWLYCQCQTVEQKTRITEELTAYAERDMIMLLKWLKYFVDTCKANNVVWGVGRGSSVASYVLYLIGVHKINSLKYNLDWREFLR